MTLDARRNQLSPHADLTAPTPPCPFDPDPKSRYLRCTSYERHNEQHARQLQLVNG